MRELLQIFGVVFVFGGVIFMCVASYLPSAKPAPVQAPPEQEREVSTAPILPPLGAPINAKRNEVWETQASYAVQISAPLRGNLTGTTLSNPASSGPRIFHMMEWRTDGVSTDGDERMNLKQVRPDVEPQFYFDEDGYADSSRLEGLIKARATKAATDALRTDEREADR